MGRPPLPIGTYGTIHTTQIAPDVHEARARFRAADGSILRPRRTGRTATAAANRLRKHLSELAREVLGGEITPQTRVREVARLWLEEVDARAERGELAVASATAYRRMLSGHVLPALGELRMMEVTVMRCDRLIQAKRQTLSRNSVASLRTALSGVCGYAMRHGALSSNPMRDVSRAAPQHKRVRALSARERAGLLAALDADQTAARLGLGDVARGMLATGVRIGELLALTGDEVDIEARTVRIEWHLVRVTGRGMVRMPGRKVGEGITLALPAWSLPMWRRRKLAAGPYPLWTSSTDGWCDQGAIAKQLHRALEPAGYGWVTTHVFRRTVATVIDEAGLPVAAMADQLGNSPAVAERHYRAPRVASTETAAALEGIVCGP